MVIFATLVITRGYQILSEIDQNPVIEKASGGGIKTLVPKSWFPAVHTKTSSSPVGTAVAIGHYRLVQDIVGIQWYSYTHQAIDSSSSMENGDSASAPTSTSTSSWQS